MMTPLVAALHRDYPGAQVDAVVSGEGSGALLADFPNFGRAFELPRYGWRHPWSWLRLTREIRRERYDLTLDPAVEKGAGRSPLMHCTTKQRVRVEGI
ncbi:glycosyltransferase family 9 protein [Dokdonella sp.]|uniref:glycosyltransferase family 9 protein n=1 Tax=Dokdonella sp. TaxID=2291710 RepID=UPI003C623009